MQELIKITATGGETPTVSARDLHEFLQAKNFFKNIAKKFAVFKKGVTFVATNNQRAINALYSISRLFLCLELFNSLKGRYSVSLIRKIGLHPLGCWSGEGMPPFVRSILFIILKSDQQCKN